MGECLSSAWITEKYPGDIDSIKAYLDSPADAMQLQKLKTASSLVEAPNIEKKPDVKKLQMMLAKAKDKTDRNKIILKAYSQGYSQHLIAKVLELNQSTVQRIIKRTRGGSSISIT